MSLNPYMWSFGVKAAVVGSAAMLVAGGVTYALMQEPGTVKTAASSPSEPGGSPVSAPSPSPSVSGLSASCQVGSDGNPADQQNYDQGGLDYLITLTNGTSSPVTVTGYTVTFTAFTNQTVDTETPTVNTFLAEPGEQWSYTGTYENAPQVSETTYLNETCQVTEADTDNGQITPNAVSEPDGQQNTHSQDIQQAQQNLASDASTLSQDANTLNSNSQLASDLKQESNDYASEEGEYKTEQGDNCTDMGGDAEDVGGDAEDVGGDLEDLNADIKDLQGQDGIGGIQSDIIKVNGDLATLKNLGASPSTNASPALAAGTQAIKNANGAISYAQGQGGTINSGAQSLAATATSYANAHGC